MIVLGVDPSLCNLGIAAVELMPGGEVVRETRVVRTEPSAKKRRVLAAEDQARRVAELARGLEESIAKHAPACMVVEAPAGSKGAQAARALGLAFGAVIAVAEVHGLPLVQVTPGDVKRAMCSSKSASKDEIIQAVEARYPDVEWPSPAGIVEHAADAIGAVVAALGAPELKLARRLSA